MAEERQELPQGTLDLLILKSLGLEPLHGAVAGLRRDGPPRKTTGGRNTTS